MRLENRTVQKVDIDVLGKTRMPLPHELGVPGDADNVLPCWTKKWNSDCVLIEHRYGYTYE